MRSFQLPSPVLTLSISLLSSSLILAQLLSGHDKPHGARPRHPSNKLHSTLDAKYKRDASAAFTHFTDGLGACGTTSGPNDFIVALNSAEYESGAHCFEVITITVDGKTAQAQIVDECSGCSPGGLDLSDGLFEYFAPLSEGELYGSWSYNSDIITSSSTPAPSSTGDTNPWTSPTTTSLLSTVSTMITTSSTSSAVPSSTLAISPSTTQDPQMITQINLAILELGVLLQASL